MASRSVYAVLKHGGIGNIKCIPDGGFPPFYEVKSGDEPSNEAVRDSKVVEVKDILRNRKGKIAFFAKKTAPEED